MKRTTIPNTRDNEASIERALDHHTRSGAIRSWRCSETTNGLWVIEIPGYATVRYNLEQASALCVGLAASERCHRSNATITAEDLCKVLNTSALSPWRAGFVIVNSVRLRIDRDASAALKERKIGSVDASTGNRWLVAGGLEVELVDGAGWVPAQATKL